MHPTDHLHTHGRRREGHEKEYKDEIK
jgi:hypothetical protein